MPEQKSAIERHAARANFVIVEWFEEQQTAAKGGRPVWTAMLKKLRRGMARGVIIHKIDRSARNLKDWADLGELIDQGIEVHFANESLDLQSRSGRLSADIQAVVAADYIRNLREETKKGLYGRLKQGFYPLRAPIGYLDNGAAKVKTIDPIKGPLVRAAFLLYTSGQWSIPTLVEELYRRGLRNSCGGKVTQTGLHTILRSRFYIGVIHVRASGQTFEGKHEALISKSIYDRAQEILHGRIGTRAKTYDFLFRRTIRCVHCRRSLIGELKKGHVYYRCHTKTCPTTNIREEMAAELIAEKLNMLRLSEKERAYLTQRLAELKVSWIRDREQVLQGLRLRIEQLSERLNRTTDAFLDGALDRQSFEDRKAKLIEERRSLLDRLADFEANRASAPDELQKCIELAGSAYSLYQSASTEKKRQLLRIVMSNCAIDAKTLEFTWRIPFREIAEREKNTDGAPCWEMHRTLRDLIDGLTDVFTKRPEDISSITEEWPA